jgi:short-subunit dehydrogenase
MNTRRARGVFPLRYPMDSSTRQLAVVTGASSGIGRELAMLCAKNGYDLVVAADEATIHEAAQQFRALGASVDAVQADLATLDGVDRLHDAIGGRAVHALCANAGHGLGRAFLDQDFEEVRHVIDTNITGTVYLIQKIGREMRTRGNGRILITGSIAGFMPGTFQAVYNGTKAFIDSFSFALRAELKDSGVTVTCLMPGATETEFFERADLMDTRVGVGKKDDPAMVARVGFDAMQRGDGDVVAGWKNKLQSTVANVTPAGVLAEQHRKMAEPGGAYADRISRRRTARADGRRGLQPQHLLVGAGVGAALAYLYDATSGRRRPLRREQVGFGGAAM